MTLVTARQHQQTACDAASARRFRNGVRCTQVVPYTAGPAALRLAAALPALRHLSLHEATSCLGGMTDEFAAAVAAHCPQLTSLEVAFTRYSLPSECFTDAGAMALIGGCPRLRSLSLTNCGAITDRSLYAVAVHCRGLTSLALGGYHELITDYGTVVLFQACTSLERVVLSGKLRRVTDDSSEALAAGSGATLQEVKLTRSMGDKSLAAFAAHCKALRLVDCCKCDPSALTVAGVASLLKVLSAAAAKANGASPAAASPPAMAAMTTAEAAAPAPAVAAPETAAADSTAAAARIRAGAGGGASRNGKGHVVRVVLPHGLAAADVVRLASSSSNGTAARWEAVKPAALTASAATGTAAPNSGSAAIAAGARPSSYSYSSSSASSSPSSSLSSSPSGGYGSTVWVNGCGVVVCGPKGPSANHHHNHITSGNAQLHAPLHSGASGSARATNVSDVAGGWEEVAVRWRA